MGRDNQERALSAHRDLIEQGVIRPVLGAEEASLWIRCDLANMVEGSFDVRLNPPELTYAEQQRWLDRLGSSYSMPSIHDPEVRSRRYWMLDDGRPVGTLLLELQISEEQTLHLFALYTFPDLRRRGHATRTLTRAQAAVRAQGLGGIRLDTYWTWQKSLRFYIDRSMWVSRWERNIELFWHRSLPDYRVEALGDRATFSIHRFHGWQSQLEATRDGDRLHLRHSTLGLPALSRRAWMVRAYGSRTFAVALALRGWPLLRDLQDVKRGWDGIRSGDPEGLALKIELSEAVARGQGWVISTPRVPGLRYREADEIV